MGPGEEQKRPKLAALAFSVISHMACADSMLAQLAGSLTMGRAKPVIELFADAQNETRKSAILHALARSHLEPDRLELFDAIIKLYDRAGALRNPIGHGVWGAIDRLPDALLLINPRDELLVDGRIDLIRQKRKEAAKAGEEFEVVALNRLEDALFEEYRRLIVVYREKDFLDIIRQIESVWNFLGEFNALVRRDRQIPSGGQRKFDALARQPEIRTLIEHSRKASKARPSRGH